MTHPTGHITARELRKTEIVISYVLRYGVILSGLIIAAGLAALWMEPTDVVTSRALEPAPQSISALVHGVAVMDPVAVISLGLFVLILLPILRVFMTVALFLFERDWLYLLITTIVLAVLLSGLFFGKAL